MQKALTFFMPEKIPYQLSRLRQPLKRLLHPSIIRAILSPFCLDIGQNI